MNYFKTLVLGIILLPLTALEGNTFFLIDRTVAPFKNVGIETVIDQLKTEERVIYKDNFFKRPSPLRRDGKWNFSQK